MDRLRVDREGARNAGTAADRLEVWHDLDATERLRLLIEAADGAIEVLDPGRGYACLGRFGGIESAQDGLGADGFAPCDGRWYPRIDRLPRRPRATSLGSGAETAFVEVWVRRTRFYPRLALLHAATDGRIEILDARDLGNETVQGVEIALAELDQAYAVARRALVAEGFEPARKAWRPRPSTQAVAEEVAPRGFEALLFAFDHDRWSLAVRIERAFAEDLAGTVRHYRRLQGIDRPGLCPDAPDLSPDGGALQDPHGLGRLFEAMMGRFAEAREASQCAELVRFLDTAAALDATVRIEAAQG